MNVDLGLAGFGLLVGISFGFGALAQLVMGAGNRWLWLIAAAGWFAGGLIASEVVWGTLTVEEIQPIIDGLALDESLLGGLIGGILAIVAARLVNGTSASHPASL